LTNERDNAGVIAPPPLVSLVVGLRPRERATQMKRILSILTTALVMAAMMVIIAMAAFADTQACQDAQKYPNRDCRGSHLLNPGDKVKGKFSGK
jgi:hypothetical protein